VGAAAALLLLAGCAGHDPYVTGGAARIVGHWRIEQQVDRVTGAPAAIAAAYAGCPLTDAAKTGAKTGVKTGALPPTSHADKDD
jgi:hypothetical protein